VAVANARTAAVGDDVLNQDVPDGAGRPVVLFFPVLVDLASLPDVEMERLAVAPPKPVMAHTFYGQVGNDHIADIAAVKSHER